MASPLPEWTGLLVGWLAGPTLSQMGDEVKKTEVDLWPLSDQIRVWQI